jgi:hypothetical protein
MKGKKANMANKPNDPTGKFDVNPTPKDVYAGEDSNVLAAAKKRKKGGKVQGEKSMARCDRAPRKSGGAAISQDWTAAQKTSTRPGGDIQFKNGMD